MGFHAAGALLLPKLRSEVAEFLDGGSPVHLGMLYLPTCVGLRYGRAQVLASGFSRPSGPQGVRVGHGGRPFHSRLGLTGRICLPSAPTGLEGRSQTPAPSPRRPRLTQTDRRGTGLLYPLSITYAFRPRLRPASPAADQHRCGTLGHSVGRILTPLALLMPTFALVTAPPRVPA
jgi:hypothetical protein